MQLSLLSSFPPRFAILFFPEMSGHNVYQFRISLKDVSPTIWRQILVPEDYTFWDLHVAFQDAMGWSDCHLHEFRICRPGTQTVDRIGIPDEDALPDQDPTLAGWEIDIAEYFTQSNDTATYLYDFGDGWEHRVVLENLLQHDSQTDYPLCIAGERACPPEDCGGPGGYQRLLEALHNKSHEDHDDMLEWVGGQFDPEAFNPDMVRFSDPVERWQRAFQGPII